jgi:hypothetical protein
VARETLREDRRAAKRQARAQMAPGPNKERS